MGKTILILGGGVGGLVAANELRAKLSKEHRILLVDRETTFVRQINEKGRTAQFDGKGECFIETGDGKAGFGQGNFFAEPLPQVKVNLPARRWHAAKVLLEKDWLRRWF